MFFGRFLIAINCATFIGLALWTLAQPQTLFDALQISGVVACSHHRTSSIDRWFVHRLLPVICFWHCRPKENQAITNWSIYDQRILVCDTLHRAH